MHKRTIAVVTGSRAEYGLLYRLVRAINQDPELELQLFVTGSHLSPEFGNSVREIEADGFPITERLDILLSSDTPAGVAKSLGLGVIAFADAFSRYRPEIVVLLGDRYEALAAAQAALLLSLPIAHISGGESTEGAVDEAFRHAITKMAHLHFVAAEPYRKRVIQLGEHPSRVFNYGDPGLDNIRQLPLLSLPELEMEINFRLGRQFFLVTYHPVTIEAPEKAARATAELLAALDRFPTAKLLITGANADAGGRAISGMIAAYAARSGGRAFFTVNLGRINYLSAMKHCAVVIGNSSSGMVEAPALKKATVNIGCRQAGRLKANSIINCGESRQEIAAAVEKALTSDFQMKLAGVESLYGEGNASCRIKETLKGIRLEEIKRKRFYNVEFWE